MSSRDSNSKVVSLLRGKPRASDATLRLIDGLRDLVLTTLTERLNVMFDGADDLLFEFAERAANNNDRRLFFDTMRAVRLGRKNMLARFGELYVARFNETAPAAAPAPTKARSLDDDDDLGFTLQKSESVELTIAVSNMATKAEGLYKQMLWDIGGRVQSLIHETHAPISVEALAPATICNAFRGCAEALDVEFAVELVIFKLFDRLVIGDLGGLYTKILHYLKQNGVRSLRAPAVGGNADVPSATAAPGFEAPPQASEVPPPLPPSFTPPPLTQSYDPFQGGGAANLFGTPPPPTIAPVGLAATMMMSPSLDSQTLNVLQRVSAYAPNAAVYTNASLAADLAAAAQGQPIIGWGQRQSHAYVQRASLVGHMFNDILADPHLPTSLRTQFDGLRMSTIKVALKDIAFITDPDHPVRGLINELATMATTARTGGDGTLSRISELVTQIQKQFDIAAESLRKPSAEIELVETDQAERFIEQQMAQTSTRRQAMVKKVRRIIAEELQLRTRGCVITDDVRPLLNSAWAPMMAMHLLHHGPSSAQWKQGMNSLDGILRALDPQRPEARSAAERSALFKALDDEFRAAGLAEARVRSALEGFERALSVISTTKAPENLLPPTPPPVTLSLPTANGGQEGVGELLELLIQPGAWFLIFDHDRNESRWMKAVAYYAGLDCAAFAEFNGGNTLLLKSRTLLDDLVARKTIPIDLGPSAKTALDRFIARAA